MNGLMISNGIRNKAKFLFHTIVFSSAKKEKIFYLCSLKIGPVAQLDNAPDYGSGD